MTAEQATPHELVRSILDGGPSDVFDFVRVLPNGTRKNIPVRVQLLSVEENHAALIAAQDYAKKRGEIPKDYGDVYREAQAVELLARALRHVEKRERPDGTSYYPPLFVSSQQLRASFNEPEMAQCLNMYELVKAKFGAIEGFAEEDLDVWVERLREPLAGPFFLSRLDSTHWPELIYSLARRVWSLYEVLGQTPSSSLDTSESDLSSSGAGTTSFTELPSASSSEGESLPTDHLLTRDEAREIIAKRPRHPESE